MDTEALAAAAREAAGCTRCGLSRTRTKVVFGAGDPRARMLFVGEAPGFWEDRRGVPFCGKAGDVLDRLLAGVGLARDSVYIANVLKCRPPENRDPEPQEIAACSAWLDRQLETIRPEVVCCLGRHSLRFVLERFGFPAAEGISKVHGKVFQREDLFAPVKIVALYHPAVATYNPGSYATLEKDFAVLATL